MDDALCNGYQAAISSLSGGPTGRVLLRCQRYAGRAKSAACLRAAVEAVEQTLGVRPRRRTELVQAQLATLLTSMATAEQKLAAQREQRHEWAWQHQIFFQGITPPSAREKRQQARRARQIARARAKEASLVERLALLQAQQADVRPAWPNWRPTTPVAAAWCRS
jgi:hypothetical protein